jgi:16S rRNA G966 N2-methylase RsmD
MALVDIYNNKSVDRTAGIRKIIDIIPNLKKHTCLDLFAGDGSFCSYLLADAVNKITCVSYNQEDAQKVQKNIPKATVLACDALKVINFLLPSDIIFCDNPQGILPNGTCEYFEYLEQIIPLTKPEGYIIHNVNVSPYNYDENSFWAKKRNNFYQKNSCKKLDIEFIKNYHKNYIESKFNREVKKILPIPRELYNNEIYLYFLLYKLA